MIVEIVPARRKGVTGYVSVGRGSRWGNPYVVGVHGDAGECVDKYADRGIAASSLYRLVLSNRWMTAHLRIACPCNGLFADPPRPCHASVLAARLVALYGGEVRVWKPEEVAL